MLTEDGKVEFNEQEQVEVNRIVQERLARAESKYADHDDIKGIVEELQAFGYQGTPKEIREVIKAQREETAKQKELAELERQAKFEGTSPELLSEIRELKKELTELKGERQAQKQVEESQKKAKEAWDKQIEEFTEKHKDVDLKELLDNPKFKKFFNKSNPLVPLAEIYEDFKDLVGSAEAEAIAKIKSNVERSTTSGRQKGDAMGGTYGLSSDEQELALENGMTFKEYAQRKQR